MVYLLFRQFECPLVHLYLLAFLVVVVLVSFGRGTYSFVRWKVCASMRGPEPPALVFWSVCVCVCVCVFSHLFCVGGCLFTCNLCHCIETLYDSMHSVCFCVHCFSTLKCLLGISRCVYLACVK